MYRHQGNKWHIVDWLIDLLIDWYPSSILIDWILKKADKAPTPELFSKIVPDDAPVTIVSYGHTILLYSCFLKMTFCWHAKILTWPHYSTENGDLGHATFLKCLYQENEWSWICVEAIDFVLVSTILPLDLELFRKCYMLFFIWWS
jgi:hypothetical protein